MLRWLIQRIKSFINRDSRLTAAQKEAYKTLMPHFGLRAAQGLVNLESLFGRQAETIVEIGFGSGQSLLAIAEQHPEQNFIGIDVYLPGVGALLLGIKQRGLTNIRVFHDDAVIVLQECIPESSLKGVQIFFPDPWPKRRHHKRRLIQREFVALVVSRLQKEGILHLATDWEDYGKQMMAVLSETTSLTNLACEHHFAARSGQRPLITKFEQRGIKFGRPIWELQFAKRHRDNGM